ncbi:hypothetical protein AOLI_G00061940 [Acnodon oligacanthus]
MQVPRSRVGVMIRLGADDNPATVGWGGDRTAEKACNRARALGGMCGRLFSLSTQRTHQLNHERRPDHNGRVFQDSRYCDQQ